MADLISIVQGIVGIALFLASGYFLSFLFFRKAEIDDIERGAYSLVFALIIPSSALFFLNFLLKLPVNSLTVFAVYALAAAGSFFYYNAKIEPKHKA
ncbi:MAG: hypothetical protein ABIG96_03060 [Candidatus Micrarchaeota archaeon]